MKHSHFIVVQWCYCSQPDVHFLHTQVPKKKIQEGGREMQGQTVRIVSQAIRFIEEHLEQKIDLDTAAAALHYSKFHLHRIFTKTVGMTIHDYVQNHARTVSRSKNLLSPAA